MVDVPRVSVDLGDGKDTLQPIGAFGVLLLTQAAFTTPDDQTPKTAGERLDVKWDKAATLSTASTLTLASVDMISVTRASSSAAPRFSDYARVASEPAHPGKFLSADNAWFELNTPSVCPEQFRSAIDIDDTASFNRACTFIGAKGGGQLRINGRTYVLSDAVNLPNASIEIAGRDTTRSRILQTVAGKDVFVFSAVGSNNINGNGTLFKSLMLRDISILRARTSGGVAVRATWLSSTFNQTTFTAERVQVYADNDGYQSWDYGFLLTNCNGSKIDKCVLKGNVSESSASTANPYSMVAAISYMGDHSFGKINHFITNLTTGCCSHSIKVDGWFEGFYISNFEMVQHWIAVDFTGDPVKMNPVFSMVNGHMDVRGSALRMSHVLDVTLEACKPLKNSFGSTTGYPGALVSLTDVTHFSAVGGNWSSIDNTKPIGLQADQQCYRVITKGVRFHNLAKGVVTQSSYGQIDGMFYQCDTAIELGPTSGNNTIPSSNLYQDCNVRVSDLGLANRIEPLVYASGGNAMISSGVEVTITVPIPPGVFFNRPLSGEMNLALDGFWLFAFQSTLSTATSAVFKARRGDGGSIGAGSYPFTYVLKSNP